MAHSISISDIGPHDWLLRDGTRRRPKSKTIVQPADSKSAALPAAAKAEPEPEPPTFEQHAERLAVKALGLAAALPEVGDSVTNIHRLRFNAVADEMTLHLNGIASGMATLAENGVKNIDAADRLRIGGHLRVIAPLLDHIQRNLPLWDFARGVQVLSKDCGDLLKA